jgi:RHS repeat-associated protein
MNIDSRVPIIFVLSFLLVTAPLELAVTVDQGHRASQHVTWHKPMAPQIPLQGSERSLSQRNPRPSPVAFSYGPVRPSIPSVPTSRMARPRSLQQATVPAREEIAGQTSTLMPDGRILLIGGESPQGPSGTISLSDPQTGAVTQVKGTLLIPRSWHSATLLPDGTVFILGGVGQSGVLAGSAEIFDPTSGQSHVVSTSGLVARAHHTATLLTDGSVLIAGGVDQNSDVLGSIQWWDPRAGAIRPLATVLLTARENQTAALEPGGMVLFWAGQGKSGVPLTYGEVFDPSSLTETIETSQTSLQVTTLPPFVEASVPSDGADNVPTSTLISLRFSMPLAVQSVNQSTTALANSDGQVSANIVPAEGGILAFVNPSTALAPGSTYTVSLSGMTNSAGEQLTNTIVTFTTAGTPGGSTGLPLVSSSPVSAATPSTSSSAMASPPLIAPSGITAISGRVLQLNGAPLANATLQVNNSKILTDQTGRFLLQNVPAGHDVIIIDGASASRAGITYGIFQDGVDVQPGITNVLRYTIWMTPINTQHAISIPSPTTSETVITSPVIPGLELHLPQGSVIRDLQGKIVRQISITPIPVKQPPFPLPKGVEVPIYFTIQPGGAYLDTTVAGWTKGATLYYPNWRNAKPGTAFDFWNYDPTGKGWYVYGEGHVSKDGKSVVPDPGVEIYEFTGAMVGSPSVAPGTFPPSGGDTNGGDPVDLATGLFVYNSTDLVLPDFIPIKFTRTYRSNDTVSRPFGLGFSDSYEMFMIGDTAPYTYQELILPNGSRVHFDVISHEPTESAYTQVVYECLSSPTKWYGAILSWDPTFPGAAWSIRTKDGTKYYFPDGSYQSSAAKQALMGISDSHGNTVTITRDSYGSITQLVGSGGRYINFTSDSSHRITQATDNSGRTVQYTYDSDGHLSTVTDPNSGVTTYTYDSNDNMLTIEDARGTTYLTNQYDTNGRVSKQTLADGNTYQFSWTATSNTAETFTETGQQVPGLNGLPGSILAFRACTTCLEGYLPLISQVNITDQRGNVRQVQFGSTGYRTSDSRAYGTSIQQTTTYAYSADNLLQSTTDALSRTTTYTYDAKSNLTALTKLSGTSSAVTTSYTYEPMFSQLASVTDPMSHTASYSYDQNGNLTQITDPLGHQTTLTYNGQGQVVTIADASSDTTSFSYRSSDLVSVTDPLSRTTTQLLDEAGRSIALRNQLGQTAHFGYDGFNRPASVTDPVGNTTSVTYDANGNLLTLTDANSHTMTYTYDNMDRVATRTDPLENAESYSYDAAGNLTQFTDRRGKVIQYTYDALNRRTFAGYGYTTGPSYESTITYSYDAGNRYTSVVDSVTGTITPTFDNLNRLTQEVSPQGTIAYTYDNANRRTSATVSGQTAVDYSYDNANRLTQITQGTPTVSFVYDSSNRRSSLTLPNGVTVAYGYDDASELTGLTYTLGTTTLGSLAYSYDSGGRRINVGGSYAQTELPSAVSTTSYNAANQLTGWGSASLSYDSNGNLTNDGTNTYTWSARNKLASMNSGTISFQYDPYGRRVTKTVSGTTKNYLYDRDNIVQELSGGSVLSNWLTGRTDEIFTGTDSTGTANFLTDALSSTILLTNSSGSSIAQYAYEPFGNTTVTSGSSTNQFQFTGRENDGTGLYFNRARYYHPVFQRFVSEDPIGWRGGANLSAYVDNAPTTSTDPTGLYPNNDICDALTLIVDFAQIAMMPIGGSDTAQLIIGGAASALGFACLDVSPTPDPFSDSCNVRSLVLNFAGNVAAGAGYVAGSGIVGGDMGEYLGLDGVGPTFAAIGKVLTVASVFNDGLCIKGN